MMLNNLLDFFINEVIAVIKDYLKEELKLAKMKLKSNLY